MPAPRLTRPSSFGSALSPTELRSAVLDGEAIALGDGFAPLDLPVTAADRAASLSATLADRRVILADRTAAWVWGWCAQPGSLRTCVSITARIPSPERRRLGAREAVIDPDERRSVGGVLVTDPVRTLVDLARHSADPDVVDLLASGMRISRIPFTEVMSALSRRPRLAFVRTARARLLRAAERAAELSRC